MKKYIILFLFLGTLSNLFSQHFSTSVYLTNKNGEKDTLIVGYDTSATLGVDEEFGEFDFQSPIDTTRFSVFMTNFFSPKEGPFLKKNIMPSGTHNYFDLTAVIVIPYEDLPVTFTWDKELFNHKERNYSVITDWPPRGWVDVGLSGTAWEFLKDTSVLEIAPHKYPDDDIAFNGKKMRTVYLFFADSINRPTIGIEFAKCKSENPFVLYPNPVESDLKIQNKSFEAIQSIQVINMSGTVKSLSWGQNSLDCSSLTSGIYILKIKTTKSLYYSKFIKK